MHIGNDIKVNELKIPLKDYLGVGELDEGGQNVRAWKFSIKQALGM